MFFKKSPLLFHLVLWLGLAQSAMVHASLTQKIYQATGFQALGMAFPKDAVLEILQNALKAVDEYEHGELTTKAILADRYSTSIRFQQKLNGINLVGNDVTVHYDRDGKLHDLNRRPLNYQLNTTAKLSVKELKLLLNDRYKQKVLLSQDPELVVIQDFTKKTRLAYKVLTRTMPHHAGLEVYVDAHNAEFFIEFERNHEIQAKNIVYSADTKLADQHNDSDGYPNDLNFDWYEKVYDKGREVGFADRAASNAYRNASYVYDYFLTQFNRRSYDNNDSPVISVVHMGRKMNNAFWSTELGVMAYGDGDGDFFNNLTYGLDVTAHELTHGLTDATAKLVYAAESGALNESYSDFFGKMVDYFPGDWDLGSRVMASGSKMRALRNLMNPEEFGQPGSNDSPKRVPTNGNCNRFNDRCGVHTNSGIPSRAAALMVEAMGKEKTEQLYYKVLTTRLSATSDFKEARSETEKACALMYGGASSAECKIVKSAFDKVKM